MERLFEKSSPDRVVLFNGHKVSYPEIAVLLLELFSNEDVLYPKYPVEPLPIVHWKVGKNKIRTEAGRKQPRDVKESHKGRKMVLEFIQSIHRIPNRRNLQNYVKQHLKEKYGLSCDMSFEEED